MLFSHHQKTIIADEPIDPTAEDTKHRVVAYVGGLDLTTGRYALLQDSEILTMTGGTHRISPCFAPSKTSTRTTFTRHGLL